jgi:hypothetical protein
MPTATPVLGLQLPTVGADNNTWGGFLNGDLTTLDTLWATIGNNPFGAAALKPLTFFAQAANNLSDLTNATTARANLGLGNAATYNVGTSGNTIPLLNTNATISGSWQFTLAIIGNINGNCTGSSGSCTGNAASASTAAACSGNAASASTAAACSGNAASATQATGMQNPIGAGANSVYWNGAGWVFNVGGVATAMIDANGVRNLV